MPFKMTSAAAVALLAVLPAVSVSFGAHAEAPVKTQWGMVSEPTYPTHICATLSATITSQKGSIDAYDADGASTHPDHDRIQSAIDGCKDGAVKFVPGAKGQDGFLTGPIQLKSGVILWVDKGATLYASRDPKDYDTGAGDCGTASSETHKSCHALIEGADLVKSGIVGEGKIDARGGSRLLSGPNKGKSSWWDIAWLTKDGLTQHNFRILQTTGGSDFLMYRITFENSPNFHLVPTGNGIIAWGIKIIAPTLVYSVPGYACPAGSTPKDNPSATCFTPDTIKNTDGFDPSNANNVLLAYSWISDGDDNVAIKAGGKILSHDQTYAHNHFYYGHGMSLGSETNGGAEHFLITDLIMDGMDSPSGNGLRIKSDSSRGGKVNDFVFEDICMRNEAHPLVFDTHYSDKTGKLYPDFKGITVRNFHYISGGKYGGGSNRFRGFEEDGQMLPQEISLETVVWDGEAPKNTGGTGKNLPFATHFTIYPGATVFGNLITPSAADDVTVKHMETRSSPKPRDCTAVFVPMNSVVPDAPI